MRRNSGSEFVNGGQGTYVLDDERVARDPLHGFEQEAGQRHPLTPGIHGQPLQRAESHLRQSSHTPGENISLFSVSYLEEIFDFWVVVGLLLDQRGAVQLARTESVHKTRSVSMNKRY